MTMPPTERSDVHAMANDMTPLFPASDPLVEGVVQVLRDVYSPDFAVAPDDRDQFAFNVMLNALCSVLEKIRAADPDEYRTYLELSLLSLRGD